MKSKEKGINRKQINKSSCRVFLSRLSATLNDFPISIGWGWVGGGGGKGSGCILLKILLLLDTLSSLWASDR